MNNADGKTGLEEVAANGLIGLWKKSCSNSDTCSLDFECQDSEVPAGGPGLPTVKLPRSSLLSRPSKTAQLSVAQQSVQLPSQVDPTPMDSEEITQPVLNEICCACEVQLDGASILDNLSARRQCLEVAETLRLVAVPLSSRVCGGTAGPYPHYVITTSPRVAKATEETGPANSSEPISHSSAQLSQPTGHSSDLETSADYAGQGLSNCLRAMSPATQACTGMRVDCIDVSYLGGGNGIQVGESSLSGT